MVQHDFRYAPRTRWMQWSPAPTPRTVRKRASATRAGMPMDEQALIDAVVRLRYEWVRGALARFLT
eukprot:666452-Prymnesium_polylepis.1